MPSETRRTLIRLLSDTLGLPAESIGPDAAMENLSAWDSVTHLQFLMSVEAEFAVQFTPEEMMELRSLAAIETRLSRSGV